MASLALRLGLGLGPGVVGVQNRPAQGVPHMSGERSPPPPCMQDALRLPLPATWPLGTAAGTSGYLQTA